MDIKGKHAVVTGAASGIGRGIVRSLVRRGAASVAVVDVDEGGAQAVADEARQGGARAFAHVCDVSDETAIDELADRAWSEFGDVDLLFNNAGVTAAGDPFAATDADTRWEFDVNVFGVINGTRRFGRRFLASGERKWVCNTASHNAVGAPFPDVAGYVATKHAALGYTAALRAQFGDRIGLSVLCPGAINTGVWNAGRNRPGRFGGPVAGNPANAEYLRAHGLDADETGDLAVKGVQNEEFFIWTHPEDIELVRGRYEEARAAFLRQFPEQPNVSDAPQASVRGWPRRRLPPLA